MILFITFPQIAYLLLETRKRPCKISGVMLVCKTQYWLYIFGFFSCCTSIFLDIIIITFQIRKYNDSCVSRFDIFASDRKLMYLNVTTYQDGFQISTSRKRKFYPLNIVKLQVCVDISPGSSGNSDIF